VKLIAQKLLNARLTEANSLKSWMGQKVKSPFSNIRAETRKLYSLSGRTSVAKSLAFALKHKSPIALGTAAVLPAAAISCLGAFQPPAAEAHGQMLVTGGRKPAHKRL
jgi:hypothetical protein